MEKLIRVDSVCKLFSRSPAVNRRRGLRRIFSSFFGFSPEAKIENSKDFWALDGVSLDLHRGECVGLLGLNGAGKSTLLKVISGLYVPDRGSVSIQGNLESLIELSTGFHPALTGRENIVMKCSLKGMSREGIQKAISKIIDFSELHEFIDSPVRTYSSGMYARLGFATSVMMNPDILLIDEILSVGDFRFQQKCLKKINEFKPHAALLIVSHNLNTLKLFCDRVLVMEAGKIVFEGSADDGVAYYLNQELLHRQGQNKSSAQPHSRLAGDGLFGAEVEQGEHIESFFATCNGLDMESDLIEVTAQPKITFNLQGRIITDLPNRFIMGVSIWDQKGNLLLALNSDLAKTPLTLSEDGNFSAEVEIPNHFNVGTFKVVIALHDGPEYLYRKVYPGITSNQLRAREMGYIKCEQEWRFGDQRFPPST